MLKNEEMPLPREMELVIGGEVKLDDIIGRDELIERILSDLNSTSIIINEIRRFGKTTLLRLLETKIPDDWICIRATVQDARTTTELVEWTFQNILRHAKTTVRIKKIIWEVVQGLDSAKINFGAVELQYHLQEKYKGNVFSTFRSVLDSIGRQLKKDKKHMVIIWDEFPDAIRAIAEREGKHAAEDIMKFFRARRENVESGNIRWILTGSVGLHHVMRMLSGRSDSINDMITIGLAPIEPQYIRWMSKCLLLGIGRDFQGSDFIADISGGIPFVLEMMVKHIRDTKAAIPQSVKDAERLLIDAVSDVNLGRNWAPLLERVDSYYGEQATLAESILDVVAKTPMEQPMICDTLKKDFPEIEKTADKVLGLLFEDHYLQYDLSSNLYSWKYEPLRIIWRARRRKGM